MDNKDYGVGYLAEADQQWISCVLSPFLSINLLTISQNERRTSLRKNSEVKRSKRRDKVANTARSRQVHLHIRHILSELPQKTKKSSASVTRSPAAKGKAKVDVGEIVVGNVTLTNLFRSS